MCGSRLFGLYNVDPMIALLFVKCCTYNLAAKIGQSLILKAICSKDFDSFYGCLSAVHAELPLKICCAINYFIYMCIITMQRLRLKEYVFTGYRSALETIAYTI